MLISVPCSCPTDLLRIQPTCLILIGNRHYGFSSLGGGGNSGFRVRQRPKMRKNTKFPSPVRPQIARILQKLYFCCPFLGTFPHFGGSERGGEFCKFSPFFVLPGRCKGKKQLALIFTTLPSYPFLGWGTWRVCTCSKLRLPTDWKHATWVHARLDSLPHSTLPYAHSVAKTASSQQLPPQTRGPGRTFSHNARLQGGV